MEARLIVAYALIVLLAAAVAIGVAVLATRGRRMRRRRGRLARQADLRAAAYPVDSREE